MTLRIPGPEELEAHARATRREMEEKLGTRDPNSFCPVSLGDWLALCRQAGVTHVAAEQVAEIQQEDYLRFDTEGPHQERLLHAWRTIQAAQRPNHMMRLDCCSDAEIKHQMSRGKGGFRPEFGQIILGDVRSFDIVDEYPRETIPVWRRRWIETMQLESYPVEYRAYVRNGRLAGISNYYPQRPLPRTEEHLKQVAQHTQALIRDAQPPFLWNRTAMLLDCDLDLEKVHFTADFLATEKGAVVFLEGGPPHELGAHMCCFRPWETDGVALEDRNKPEEETPTGNPDLLEWLEWRIEGRFQIDEFVRETEELHQQAGETLYLDQMGHTVGSREDFLQEVRQTLEGQGDLRITAEVDRDVDGAALMLECRIARH